MPVAQAVFDATRAHISVLLQNPCVWPHSDRWYQARAATSGTATFRRSLWKQALTFRQSVKAPLSDHRRNWGTILWVTPSHLQIDNRFRRSAHVSPRRHTPFPSRPCLTANGLVSFRRQHRDIALTQAPSSSYNYPAVSFSVTISPELPGDCDIRSRPWSRRLFLLGKRRCLLGACT